MAKAKKEIPSFDLSSGIEERVKPRLWMNVGCLFDIVTGHITIGKKGETIINGGFGPIMAICGSGNIFKSTIMHYLVLSAADKVKQSGYPTSIMTYDTEENISLDRLNSLASKFQTLQDKPATNDKKEWVVTSKSIVPGNKWAETVYKNIELKIARKKDFTVDVECFKDPFSEDKPYDMVVPNFVEIDSFTEFEGEASMDLLTGDLDSTSTNTYAMKQGMFRTKFFTQIPRFSTSGGVYFFVTLHVGEKIDMNMNPYAPQPLKKLQYLKSNQFIKGAGSKIDFLTSVIWLAQGSDVLKNQGTKLAEYPRDANDVAETDLNIVRLTILRNKNGASGITISVIVSQVEGVLPALTEFHYCKTRDKFGIEGNDRNYFMSLYPDCSLSRTTIRKKIDTDPLLRRAINITADLLQIRTYHPSVVQDGLWCEPKELYEDLKAMGYDWNELLTTRGYWLMDQYDSETNFLSTIDLLKMRKGLYKPYFLKDKEKENGKK